MLLGFEMGLGNVIFYIFGILISVISFLSIRTLNQVDRSQKELWTKFDDHEKRLSGLEGEHKVYTGRGAHL